MLTLEELGEYIVSSVGIHSKLRSICCLNSQAIHEK